MVADHGIVKHLRPPSVDFQKPTPVPTMGRSPWWPTPRDHRISIRSAGRDRHRLGCHAAGRQAREDANGDG
jgi:hypothetical protein